MTFAICFTTIFANEVKGQTKSIYTIPNDSYDNFKHKSSYSGSYVIIKSKASGKILYEHNVINATRLCTTKD